MRRNKLTNWIQAASCVSLLLLSVLVSTGCTRENEVGTRGRTDPAAEMRQETVDIDDVAERTEQYLGQTVTVRGEVEAVKGPRAIVLDDDDLLVLTREPVGDLLGRPQYTLAPEQDVIVTGVVRRMTVAEIEEEVGWDLDRELEVNYASKPVLVASNVQLVD